MGKQPVSAQPLLSNSARGQKGATAVADAVESPRTANFDLWEDAPPEKDAQCCGVSRRCGVALVAALSVAAVGGFFLFSHRTRPITEGLIGCGTKEQCLTIIDNYYLNAKRQKYAGNGAGMVQTYGPGSIGGGPCGDEHCKLVEPCPNFAQRNPGDGTPHCRFDVYDNALTAIYLAKRGKLQESRQVLDAFIGLLYPTGNVTPGLDYGAGYLLPSRRSLTLLAAGYTDKSAEAGVYEGMGVADGAVDTGNNAWVGMAFAHYAAATADPCYSLVAHDMLAALVKSTQCTDEMQGFGSRLTPFPQNYRSTEHNTDMFALAHMLGAAGAAAEKQAGAFVRSMWEQLPDSKFSKYGSSSYAVGTANNYPCDTVVPEGPAAVDAQFWNLLADADPVPERKAASMAFAMQEQDPALTKTTPAEPKGLWARDTDLIGNGTTGVGRGAVLHGVRFTSGGNGIQWENTASACMAMCRFRALYGDQTSAGDLRPKIQAATDSIKHLLAVYGVVPASVLGGNIAAYQVKLQRRVPWWVGHGHRLDLPALSARGLHGVGGPATSLPVRRGRRDRRERKSLRAACQPGAQPTAEPAPRRARLGGGAEVSAVSAHHRGARAGHRRQGHHRALVFRQPGLRAPGGRVLPDGGGHAPCVLQRRQRAARAATRAAVPPP